MDLSQLPEAPGAKAGRHCGIWALVTLLILCFPVSLVLAIVAIVQNSKANRLFRSNPNDYRPSSNAGTIMGIVALALFPIILFTTGIVTAIAVPALMGSRSRAKDKVTVSIMNERLEDMVSRYDKMAEEGRQPADIHAALEASLRESVTHDKNPWNISVPAYSCTITIVSDLEQESVENVARNQAREVGQSVFVIQFPSTGTAPEHAKSGFLAGAARTKSYANGRDIVVKVISL